VGAAGSIDYTTQRNRFDRRTALIADSIGGGAKARSGGAGPGVTWWTGPCPGVPPAADVRLRRPCGGRTVLVAAARYKRGPSAGVKTSLAEPRACEPARRPTAFGRDADARWLSARH
jgi:hypothetical protein